MKTLPSSEPLAAALAEAYPDRPASWYRGLTDATVALLPDGSRLLTIWRGQHHSTTTLGPAA